MEQTTPPHRRPILEGEYPAPEGAYPKDDLSLRSFNGYMFRSIITTLPTILVLVAAVAAVILIDHGLR